MLIRAGKISFDYLKTARDVDDVVKAMREYDPIAEWDASRVHLYQSQKEDRSPAIKIARLLSDGRFVGCLWYAVDKTVCEIEMVYVADEFRRQGVATYMLGSLVGPSSLIKRERFQASVPLNRWEAAALFCRKLEFAYPAKDGGMIVRDGVECYDLRFLRPVGRRKLAKA
jgi:GNAT superfamily N-acetyltransferase